MITNSARSILIYVDFSNQFWNDVMYFTINIKNLLSTISPIAAMGAAFEQ